MITIKELPEKKFFSKSEAVSYLKLNKENIISVKKLTAIKQSDSFYSYTDFESKKEENKSEINSNSDSIIVKVVMNTANWLDSHMDLHVPGIWKKTMNDNKFKGFYHLQEHVPTFDHVIARNSKAYTEIIKWKELGVNIDGDTEALIFESEIKKEDNPFMFEQYRKGHVNQHSVGMQYVKIDLALCDEDDEKEMDFWNKYYPAIANKEKADESGFFWVVTEARLREGSAVLFGSNPITSTLNNNNKTEPSKDTQLHKVDTLNNEEPSEETIKNLLTFNLKTK